MTGLTWLHLSDWHHGSKEFDRQVVEDGLIEELDKRTTISPDLAKIDFIVFSGDLASSGKPEEYKAAEDEFFERLLRATGLGSDRLFIVPGNHDLNRDEFELLPPALLKPLESDLEVQKWIVEERQRGIVLQPFNAFAKFVAEYTNQKNPDFANICRLVIDGKKIALLGINSAWMCGRNTDKNGKVDDKGYVIVGESQIHKSLKDISDADIKIAILHHPFEWLREFDRRHIEERLTNECDFILNGHQHTPYARQISRNNGFYVNISTGASYADRIPIDPLFINAYNFVHLDFQTKLGIIFLRRWSDRQNKWLDDADTHPPDGKLPFSLVTSLTDNLPAQIKSDEKISTHKTESSSIVIPRQIPQPPRDFKGRENEIRDILSNFDKGATITGLRGMPGVGKTVLAFKLAERLKDRFPDGQLFLNLQGTSKNPLNPAEAIAQVIHAYHPTDRIPENQYELRGRYLSILSGKRVLILIDNAANKEQVEPLLPPAGCSVLITSRIKFTLPGLQEKDLDVLPIDKACELLLEIAEQIGIRAKELAKLCGCLPLALRNAASALAERKDLGVAEYERLLRDKQKRLELVDASFSLSYDLLFPMRRTQWGRLSVFPEDFDRSGGAAVWKMGHDPSAEALGDLVKWNLVLFNPFSDSEEEGRYRLHDLARIFADSRLDSIDRADAQYRHAKHYLKVLSDANKRYMKRESSIQEGLELFDREWLNIKAGQAWAENMIQTVKRLEKTDSLKSALKLANSYPDEGANILDLRMHPHDRIRWLETALNAIHRMKDQHILSAHLGNLGSAYWSIGETRKAIVYYNQALQANRKNKDWKGEGDNLGNLGCAYFVLGEVRKSIDYYNRSLVIDRKAKDRRDEAISLNNLCDAYLKLGEIPKAIDNSEQALKICREIGDLRGKGLSFCCLGKAHVEMEKTQEAIGYLEQSLEICQEIGDSRTGGENLYSLGRAYTDKGEPKKAIGYLEQALETVSKIGDRRGEGEALCWLGRAYADIGEPQKAIGYLNQALEIVHKIEYRQGEGNSLFYMSLILYMLGNRTEAINRAKSAQLIFEQIESPYAKRAAEKLSEWQI